MYPLGGGFYQDEGWRYSLFLNNNFNFNAYCRNTENRTYCTVTAKISAGKVTKSDT
jgi:hypothetical protein